MISSTHSRHIPARQQGVICFDDAPHAAHMISDHVLHPELGQSRQDQLYQILHAILKMHGYGASSVPTGGSTREWRAEIQSLFSQRFVYQLLFGQRPEAQSQEAPNLTLFPQLDAQIKGSIWIHVSSSASTEARRQAQSAIIRAVGQINRRAEKAWIADRLQERNPSGYEISPYGALESHANQAPACPSGAPIVSGLRR